MISRICRSGGRSSGGSDRSSMGARSDSCGNLSRGRPLTIGGQYLLGIEFADHVHALVSQMRRVDEKGHAFRPGVWKQRPDIVVLDQSAARGFFIGQLLKLDRAVAENISVGWLRGALSAHLVLILRKIALKLHGPLFDRSVALR